MTNPGPGGQWPHQGGPQQWGHQQPGTGQYGTPQQQPYPGQSPYPPQQPYQGQPPYGSPQFSQAWQPYGPQGQWSHGAPPPSKSKRAWVIGLVVALVVVLGSGATWLAVSQTGSVAAGAATPTEAAQNLAASVGNGDIVGLLSTLAPAEAALLTDPLEETTAELKRIGILDESADPAQLTGVRMETTGLVFDTAGEERINDHLTITKLTGGTLTITADLSKIPLSEEFIEAARDNSERAGLESQTRTETVDIAEFIRNTGEPIRIATVQVDDEWYPSLLYTMADYVLLEEGIPWPTESIPANGAASPNEAVRQTLQAALDADVRRVIELLPPDEMGVLHDAGPAILNAAVTDLEPTGVKVERLETETSQVAGGTKAVLTALELSKDGGTSRFSLTKSDDCYELVIDGGSERICADEFARMAQERSDSLPPEADGFTRSLATGLFHGGLGVVTTEVDGKHYVSPLRTVNELGMIVLRSFQPGDIEAMLRLAD
ncbi:flagellar basal body protein FliL [Amycolatopsis palatopharyngis]|uniref:flagellar basal body protein FliL n=1 Tax=Amycolatopsis palatopharyngis TaxID=187982 RepID=UPI000E2750DC|nr:flagellar basal body protein FliL [Amycolatopsis palatopharyngis]